MDWPAIGVTLFSMTTAGYGALRVWRDLGSRSQAPLNFYPAVEVTRESTWFLLNLAVVNNSLKEVWAEECVISLSEFDGVPSRGFQATCQGTLRIREFARPGEALRIGLCETVYDAAGRPQDEYSFLISGTLTYSIDEAWYSQAFQPRRIKMRGINPIEVRRTRKGPGRDSDEGEARRLIGKPSPATEADLPPGSARGTGKTSS